MKNIIPWTKPQFAAAFDGAVVKPVSLKRTCTLVREGGKLYLNVEADGLTILVR